VEAVPIRSSCMISKHVIPEIPAQTQPYSLNGFHRNATEGFEVP
jgi:hypothetical protein